MRKSVAFAGGRDLRHRVFFALVPAPEVSARICLLTDLQFARRLLGGLRVQCQCLHISLNWLGDYSDLRECPVTELCDVASNLTALPSTVVLNCARSFDNDVSKPRVLAGDDGVIGVYRLYDMIHVALSKSGCVRPRKQSFTPHLTLSREQYILPDELSIRSSGGFRSFA